jgi:quinol monooxygenase YgiN
MEKELVVKWKIKAAELPGILELLPELAEKTRSEDGNVFYEIYRSESEPTEFVLRERYVDDEAAQAHRNSEHYQRIVAGKIIPHLEVREVMVVKRFL